MSKVGNMILEIEELAYSGIPNEEIIKQVDAPLRFVEDVVTNLFETMYDGQPDEAQEWHDFDPDC